MKASIWLAVITIVALTSAPLSYTADEKTGIFELPLQPKTKQCAAWLRKSAILLRPYLEIHSTSNTSRCVPNAIANSIRDPIAGE